MADFEQRVNSKGFKYWQNQTTGEVTWEYPAAAAEVSVAPDYASGGHGDFEKTGDWTLYHDENG